MLCGGLNSMSWRLQTLSGETVWNGDPHPSPKRLSQLLGTGEYSQQEITYFTLQILRKSPPKSIGSLLNILTCNVLRTDGIVDTKLLSTLDVLNTSSYICGKPLKKGDIVWTCRQCAHDSSCVQCNDCFQQSDHTNHEVYFYTSSGGGGCCDCGDTEAWKESGACPKHRTDDSSAPPSDPLSLLPPEIITGFNSVLQGVVLFIYSMIVRELEGFYGLPAAGPPTEMILRLHNDDIHSYDEVISALSEIELPLAEAEQKTVAVDKAGYAIVKRLSDSELIASDWGILAQKASLLVSVVPSEVASLEESVSATWVWLHHITAKHVGLLRLLTNAFLIQSSGLPPLSYPYLPLRHRSSSSPPFEVLLPTGVDGTSPDAQESATSLQRLTPFGPELKNSTSLTLLSLLIASSPYLIKEWQSLLHDLVIVGLKDLLFKALYSQFLLHLYPHLSALFCHGIGTDKESLFHTTVQIYSTESIVSMLSSSGYLSRSRPCDEPTLQGEGVKGVIKGQASSFSLIPVLTSCFDLFLKSCGIFDAAGSASEEEVLSSFSFRNQRYRHLLHDLDFAMTCGNQHSEFFLTQDKNGRSPVAPLLPPLSSLLSVTVPLSLV
jgi:hypothetical protein